MENLFAKMARERRKPVSTPVPRAEMALTPRPGEPLRWCAHDRKLLHVLTRPDVSDTLTRQARAYVGQLAQQPTVTLEQAAWLRSLARRVSFRDVNGTKKQRALGF